MTATASTGTALGWHISDPIGEVTADSVRSRFSLAPAPEEETYGELATRRNSDQWFRLSGQVVVTIEATLHPSIDGQKLKGYLTERLLNRGCKGNFTVWGFSQWRYIFQYKFSKKDMCPLCKVVHDGYGFDYKAAHGRYGGWKCWKTNEWEQDYTYDGLELFTPHPRLW